ncbi:uncharacterized protein LOC116261143 [Nymphaea colorata]|uniref:Transmembrane protein n=1 Tax=Nymphaea colorata TaxID=210225 RepID=A0A5K1GP93_9MAGN|nr:uncharacterized protein LOC116261143 [Nymphaea colorata]
MSLPVPFQSQPTVGYPHPVVANGTPHSKGTFGPVFAVLAVITVLAAIACCIGRLCARRYSRPKTRHDRTFDARADPESGMKEGMPRVRPTDHKHPKEAKVVDNVPAK